MKTRIQKITLRGYKTIRELRSFEPKAINVLIGANGVGKSNLISFFRLLSWMTVSPGNLQEYVATQGGANSILHDGARTTPAIEAEITLETDAGVNDYFFRLAHAAGDTLIFTDEKYRFSRRPSSKRAEWQQLDSGHKESRMFEHSLSEKTAGVILGLLRNCRVHQFHDTSSKSQMRGKWRENDARWLKEDAGNLAPVLYRLRTYKPEYYAKITGILRQVLPFFADFELEPEYGSILLKWREVGTYMVFDSSQASDGMLRTMALITLLAQPEEDLPGVLILDEPELGLHPAAIEVVSGLIRSASLSTQVIIATQSTAFVNQFEPEEVVIVERKGRETTLKRLEEERLTDWLEEYSLAELWEKNVLGGRPA